MKTYLLLFSIVVFSFQGCMSKTKKDIPNETENRENVHEDLNQNDSTIISEKTSTVNKELDEEKKINVIKEFYTTYFKKALADDSFFFKENEVVEKFCSEKLLKKLKSFDGDFDPVIVAQDISESWVESITVTKKSEEDDTYYVNFRDESGDYRKNHITLSIVKSDNSYLIDDILWEE